MSSSAAGILSDASTGASVLDQGLVLAGLSNPFTAPIAAVLEIASVVASLFGNSHPEGHDYFVSFGPNGALAMDDNEGGGEDATTNQIGQAYIQAFSQIFTTLKSQGYVFTNPPFIIEIRDDGSPAMLFTNVIPSSKAPGGYAGASGWSDKPNAGDFTSLGDPSQLQTVASNLLNWMQGQGYITAPAPATALLNTILTPSGLVETVLLGGIAFFVARWLKWI